MTYNKYWVLQHQSCGTGLSSCNSDKTSSDAQWARTGLTISGMSCRSCGWSVLVSQAMRGKHHLARLFIESLCISSYRACLQSAHMEKRSSRGDNYLAVTILMLVIYWAKPLLVHIQCCGWSELICQAMRGEHHLAYLLIYWACLQSAHMEERSYRGEVYVALLILMLVIYQAKSLLVHIQC